MCVAEEKIIKNKMNNEFKGEKDIKEKDNIDIKIE